MFRGGEGGPIVEQCILTVTSKVSDQKSHFPTDHKDTPASWTVSVPTDTQVTMSPSFGIMITVGSTVRVEVMVVEVTAVTVTE